MQTRWSVTAEILVCSAALGMLVLIAGSASAEAPVRQPRYVCTPCGLPCDAKFFDAAGTCPDCGMPLIEESKAKEEAADSRPGKKVAVLVFDGAEIIDFTGPYEVFGAADFDVYTVARSNDAVTTAMGLKVVPAYTFENAPLPDVLVVPGGGVKATQNDSATLGWIRRETALIQHTMSVCNGSFILASAGLLDGLSATTTYGNIPRLRSQFPKITVVDDQRYVDNGKIITTAGLSAGIDGALHVVELLMGKGYAEQIALIEEYDWHPGTAFVRAALADRLIPDLGLASNGDPWDLVSTEGNNDRWENVYQGKSEKTLAGLAEWIEKACVTGGKWTRNGGGGGTSLWAFTGKDGKAWEGDVTVREGSGGAHRYIVTVRIARGR